MKLFDLIYDFFDSYLPEGVQTSIECPGYRDGAFILYATVGIITPSVIDYFLLHPLFNMTDCDTNPAFDVCPLFIIGLTWTVISGIMHFIWMGMSESKEVTARYFYLTTMISGSFLVYIPLLVGYYIFTYPIKKFKEQ